MHMDPDSRNWLACKLFDSVTQPLHWRPLHLDMLEVWIDEYIARGIEQGVAERLVALRMQVHERTKEGRAE